MGRRRLVVGVLILLAVVVGGLQVHVASERNEAARWETAQHEAEHDERTARTGLATVNSRLVIAKAEEDAARDELDRARGDLTAKGLDEATIAEAQVQTAKRVKDLRAERSVLAKAIAEQKQQQPVAGTCLFDLLRGLGRVASGHDGGAPSPACAAVASRSPGPR